MFEGMDTGLLDRNGKPIRCGDRIVLHEHKDAYTQTWAEDGWGRDIRLCQHEYINVPAKDKSTEGTVVYNPKFARFCVDLDDYMLDTGVKDPDLHRVMYSGIVEVIE